MKSSDLQPDQSLRLRIASSRFLSRSSKARLRISGNLHRQFRRPHQALEPTGILTLCIRARLQPCQIAARSGF